MACIRKRNSKWHVQIRRLGHKSITKSFTTREAADKWARKTEALLDNSYWSDGNLDLLDQNLAVLLTRYLKEITPHKKHPENEAYFIKRLLRDPLASLKLRSLTTEKLQQFVDKRAAISKPASVRREFAVIRHCLNTARQLWGYPLKDSITSNVRLPRLAQPSHNRLPQKLIRLIDEPEEPIAWLASFALETAMRRGEILNLKWSDVDLSRRLAYLRDTKNGHARYVPLTDKAMAAIEQGDRNSEYVFPLTANALRFAWTRFKKKQNIEGVRFHDLRHEAISRFFELGLTVPEVASISGHRTVSMLFRYAHSDFDALADKISILNK
jgi:integrase